MIIELFRWDTKTDSLRLPQDGKARGMSFHAAILSALTGWTVEHELGMAEFGAHPSGSPEKASVDNEAAPGAVFDRDDTHVLKTFG